MSNKNKQNFGGPWTEEKLQMFKGYLDAYLTVLKYKSFNKVYIDAFAGTGSININSNDEQAVIAGSAKRALSSDLKFDHYYFIEFSKKKCEELQIMVNSEFPDLADRVTVHCGDANKCLSDIIDSLDWRITRCLLFIDPFATAFKWESLEKVAGTKGIDLWYLFPYSALNRMLKRHGNIDDSWKKRINSLLGTDDWEKEFYNDSPQLNLFATEPEQEKDADLAKITEYILQRLRKVFPRVASKAYVFENNSKTPMFLFCFAVSNTSKSAQDIAIRIASYIIDYHNAIKAYNDYKDA